MMHKNSFAVGVLLVLVVAKVNLLAGYQPTNHERLTTSTDSIDFKLPEFESDSPRYCYFRFPAVKESSDMLVVIDGSRLYVDRNLNRDLTDSDEVIRSTRKEYQSESFHQFNIGEVFVGDRTHRKVSISVSPLEIYGTNDEQIQAVLRDDPNANAYILSAEIEIDLRDEKKLPMRVLAMAGISDLDGVLQFGERIEDAPTINWFGDLEIRLASPSKLRPKAQTDIITVVGTNGDGPGTFVSLAYDGLIPPGAHPRAVLEVSESADGEPKRLEFELGHRC